MGYNDSSWESLGMKCACGRGIAWIHGFEEEIFTPLFCPGASIWIFPLLDTGGNEVGFPCLIKHFPLSSECDDSHGLKRGISNSAQQEVFFLQTPFQWVYPSPTSESHFLQFDVYPFRSLWIQFIRRVKISRSFFLTEQLLWAPGQVAFPSSSLKMVTLVYTLPT